MAQAKKIQDEPSMEDILASIRRIIEDSETEPRPANGNRNEASAQAAEPAEPEAHLGENKPLAHAAPVGAGAEGGSEPAAAAGSETISEAAPSQELDPEVESFRNMVAAQERQKNPIDALNMADIQAEVMRGGSATQPRPSASIPPRDFRSSAPPGTQPATGSFTERERAGAPGVSAPAAKRETETSFPAVWSISKPEEKPGVAKVTADHRNLSSAERHSPPAANKDAGGDAVNRPAIISERASRQVAAAFDELSEAFAKSRRRSFDEIAEEMMRPLLQDWLDNNLPVLVERLVREEIDRVARGERD